MQRVRNVLVAACVAAVVFPLVSPVSGATSSAGTTARAPELHWPLSRPSPVITGGYGESRAGRFHAGLDLSTGGTPGLSVQAPADVQVERVRASSSGYGRSLYLRTGDGRLVVLGHLDAFDPAVAAYVDSAQRATGDYEVDLWPAPGRFRFLAGERVAWSGQSGAGPPHLHAEIRHGDFALEPLQWGYVVRDTIAPRLEAVLLEPLDEKSWVARGAEPRRVKLGVREDTLMVEGRVRLTLVANDATLSSHGLPVYAQGARFAGQWVECRRDSLSWAGEMGQINWLVDRGRVLGSDGVILDAPAGWRPRFLLSSRSEREAVELVKVLPNAPAQPLELYARDAAGNESTRRVWLRGPTEAERGPRADRSPLPKSAARARTAGAPGAPTVRWSFASLPDQRARVRVSGAPAGLREVRIERGAARGSSEDTARATWDGHAWNAVLHVNGTPDPDGLWLKATGPDGKTWWHRGPHALWPTNSELIGHVEDWAAFGVLPGSTYEDGVVMSRGTPLTDVPPGAAGIRATLELLPVMPPLREPAIIVLSLPQGVDRDRVGVMHRDGEGETWEWTDARWDSGGVFRAESPRVSQLAYHQGARVFRLETLRLGQFALVRDETAPEIVQRVPAGKTQGGAYSTWSLTARVLDRASGVSGSSSGFTVDGTRVPTEWDAEAGLLRWRPLAAPSAGRHEYSVEAVDRAGNRTVRTGTFVIASH